MTIEEKVWGISCSEKNIKEIEKDNPEYNIEPISLERNITKKILKEIKNHYKRKGYKKIILSEVNIKYDKIQIIVYGLRPKNSH